MNRIEKIRKYREKKDTENLAIDKIRQDEAEILKARIRGLKPRITELLEVANACKENGIEINKYGKTFKRTDDKYIKGTFITNSESCRVGFVDVPHGCKIEFIGMQGKGYNYHFRTNGMTIANADDKNYLTEPSFDNMVNFLKDFDVFEAAFYEYVDSIVGEG